MSTASLYVSSSDFCFFFQAEDGIRDDLVTGVQTCALPIYLHRLAIHGLVRTPKRFTMDDVLRLPSESRIHFIECSGNTGNEWNGPSGMPVQLTHGLLSCCEWTGVRLSTLLEEAGGLTTQAKSSWLLAEGSDAAAMTRSLPLDRILDLALVVCAQRDQRLRPENCYPLRPLVPGSEGTTHAT